MRDPYQNWSKTKLKSRMLAFDASLDTGIFRIRGFLVRMLDRANAVSRIFSVKGWRFWTVQFLSEGVTLGVFGAILALALALATFDLTADGLPQQEDYAVTFLDRYGNEIGNRGILQDDSFDLQDLPDHFIKSVLSTEDRRFFEHFGIDFFGLARAMVENARAGGVVQGGSTLTQQLAKNLFLTNERTIKRKIDEAFLALWLETHLTKQQILKLYLDRAYMGGGAYGIAAAAEFYFGKSAKDLTLAESAMMAGLFKAPTKYAPHINLPKARERAKEVLYNMVQAGFLTEGQIVVALRDPASPIERSVAEAPNFYLDWAFEEVKKIAGGRHRVLTAKTSIDMTLQKQSEQAVERSLRDHGKQYRVSEAAAVLMEPNGAVVAMVGGRDYGNSQFNRATDAKRQPGSSFKPFVYTAAMMNGYSPKSVVRDAPITIGNWSPKNYNRSYSGPVTLKNALTRSINTVPVRLAEAFGRNKIVEIAHKMGVQSELLITRSLPLGAAEVTVLDMATSYAVFANAGKKVTPHAVLQLQDSRGRVIFDAKRDIQAEQIVPEKAIAGMNEMLVNVVTSGTGRRARLPGITAAGKTGTTSAYKDAWFCGYTGNYSAAVWFGNDNSLPTRRLTGGRLPAMTWKAIMSAAHQQATLKAMPFIDNPALFNKPNDGIQLAAGQRIKDIAKRRGVQRLSPAMLDQLDRMSNLFRPASGSEGRQIPIRRDQATQSLPTKDQHISGLVEVERPRISGLVDMTSILR